MPFRVPSRSLPQSRQAIPLVFAFLTLLLTLLATPLFALPREKDRWIELTTENFTLYSNINRSKTMEIAENLEHLRSIFSMNTAWKLQSPLPSRVYIFGSRSEFDPYKPLYQGKPKELAGYFLSHPNGNFIALNGSARSTEQTMATIYHEYLHYLIRNNLQGIPLWLNEGLAEYYSTFRVFKNRADVGLPVRRHLEWVQNYELIPLERLFEIDSSSTEYNEGTRRGVFYAQSWTLVHYLLRSDPQRAAQLSRFLQLTIDEGRETKAAFLEAFGTDFASLEKEIRVYARSLLMKYNRIRVDDLPDASIQIRELPYAEVLALLGNLLGHQHQDRSEEAATHFRAALEREPKNTMALAGMADYLAGKGEREKALALYLDALKDNGDNHMLHFRYAEFLLGKSKAQGKVDHEKAISSLWQSTEIRPDFAPAWRMLTYAYTFQQDPPEEAIKVGETAFKMHPGRDDVAHNLLVIYLRREEADGARHLVANYFRANATPERFRRAANDLLNMEMNLVSGMLNARRTEEALAYLEEMLPKALLPEHVGQIQVRMSIVRKRIDKKRISKIYTKALQLMNAGENDEAEVIFTELAAGESDYAAKAQNHLQEIERRKSSPPPPPPRRSPRPAQVNTNKGGSSFVDSGSATKKHNQFADEYNRAVDHVNNGDHDAAIVILEKLMPDLEEGSANFLKARRLLFKARSQL